MPVAWLRRQQRRAAGACSLATLGLHHTVFQVVRIEVRATHRRCLEFCVRVNHASSVEELPQWVRYDEHAHGLAVGQLLRAGDIGLLHVLLELRARRPLARLRCENEHQSDTSDGDGCEGGQTPVHARILFQKY